MVDLPARDLPVGLTLSVVKLFARTHEHGLRSEVQTRFFQKRRGGDLCFLQGGQAVLYSSSGLGRHFWEDEGPKAFVDCFLAAVAGCDGVVLRLALPFLRLFRFLPHSRVQRYLISALSLVLPTLASP